MKFGERIKNRRTELGLTQAQVADKLYVTRQTVSNWEQGKNYPDLNMLVKISDVYQVSIDSLLKEDQQLKDYLSKDDVKHKYGNVNSTINMLIGILMMTTAITDNPAIFPKQIASIIGILASDAVIFWLFSDAKFNDFISSKSDDNYLRKLFHSKILFWIIIGISAALIFAYIINMIVQKPSIIFNSNFNVWGTIIIFILGLVIFGLAGYVKALEYIYNRKSK